MQQFRDEAIALADGRLRAPREDDLADITAACNDDATRAWLPLPIPYGTDDARDFVRRHSPSQLTTGAGIERALESQGRLCGMVGLGLTSWSIGSTEAGYWLAPWARGRGLMTAALMAMTDFAFSHGLSRVEVRIATGNHASIGVALRSGFRLEGTLRRAGMTHQGPVDLLVLSRLVTDPPL